MFPFEPWEKDWWTLFNLTGVLSKRGREREPERQRERERERGRERTRERTREIEPEREREREREPERERERERGGERYRFKQIFPSHHTYHGNITHRSLSNLLKS